ncbi:MAG: DUF748 domain-containing protein [Campylobacteraceae bacterium]|jgi:hypothetical protein|nr:DUF748 domain-containing protein [Campylobacteraceae bacterium]
MDRLLWPIKSELFAKIVFMLTLLYSTLFFAVPFGIKYVLQNKLKDEYGVTLALQSFRFEPLTARVTMEGFALTHKNEPLLSFDILDFDFSYYSFTDRAFIVDSITLDGLKLKLSRDENKTLNIQKIFPLKKEAKKEGEPYYFSINNINIKNANIDFFDEITKQHYAVAKAYVSLPFISTVPHDTEIFTQPSVKGVFNGSSFSFVGKSRPFAKDMKSDLSFSLKEFDISQLNAFLPQNGELTNIKGSLSLDAKVVFEKAKTNRMHLGANVKLKEADIKTKNAALKTKELILSSLLYSLDEQKASLGYFDLKELGVFEKDGARPLSLSSLELKNLKADIVSKELGVDSVAINGVDFDIVKDKSGVNVAKLAPQKESMKKDESGDEKPWKISAKNIHIDGKGSYKDSALLGKKPYSVDVESFFVDISDLQNREDKPFKVKTEVNAKEGQVLVDSNVNIVSKKAEGELAVKKAALYVIDRFGFLPPTLRLQSGELSASCKFAASFDPKKINIDVKSGSVDIRKFALYTEKKNFRLLSFETLALSNIKSSYPDPKTEIGGVALSGFYANLWIDENKTLNLARYFKGAEENKSVKTGTPETSTEIPDFTIRKFTLQGGKVDFEDRSLKQHFKTTLTDIAGSIGQLSLDKNKSAAIDLRANSGGYGRIGIKGDVVPDKQNFALKLKAQTIDVPMTQFTPYTEKFIGYKIESGNLGLDLDYQVYGRKLESSNKISLLGFNLGEEVESEGAVKLPYKLAIAILKDDKGNIDVEIPVQGSLDDPEIKSGQVVWKLIKQLIIKIIKSPFSALASLFGGGDDLGYITFDAGSSILSDAQAAKIKKIAEIINKKPALKPTLTGYIDAENDIKGYKEREFNNKLIAAKVKDMKLKSAVGVKIEPLEYEKYLKAAYKAESFPKPKNMLGFEKGLNTTDMKTLIITHIEASQKEMESLAKERMLAVKAELVKNGINENRIVLSTKPLSAPEQKEKIANSRVEIGFSE